MKKETIILLSCCYFLLAYLFLSSYYHAFKEQFVLASDTIITTAMENNGEKELIRALKSEEYSSSHVLEKYGLNNISSLDYLPSLQKFKRKYYLEGFALFLFLYLFFLLLIVLLNRKKKKEFQILDAYFYNLLYNDKHILFDSQGQKELEMIENDILKVTRRLQNALASEEQAKKNLRQTLADISHQLKTPLTSLSVLNEALTYEDIKKSEKKAFLQKQEETILHMKTLINALLKVSQIESGMIVLNHEKTDLSKIIKTSLENLNYLITSKELIIEMEKKEVFIYGDKYWLTEAITNILKNACEHSFLGGKISITLKKNPMYVCLKIKDYGEGIKESDLPHVFERFYRCGKDKESVGIGLNLTKSILDKTKATIKVTSEYGKYTLFEIHFFESVI